MIFCRCIWGQVNSYTNRFGAALTVHHNLTVIQSNKGGMQVTAKQGSSNCVAFFLAWDEMVAEWWMLIYSCQSKSLSMLSVFE